MKIISTDSPMSIFQTKSSGVGPILWKCFYVLKFLLQNPVYEGQAWQTQLYILLWRLKNKYVYTNYYIML